MIGTKSIVVGLVLALSGLSITLPAQKLKERMADKYMADLDLPKAIEVYEDMAKKNQEDMDLLRTLADTYHMAGRYDSELSSRNKLVGMNGTVPEDIWKYAEALRDNGKYEEALIWYQNFYDIVPTDERAAMYVEDKGFFERMERDKGNSELRKLSINSENSDFGLSFMDDMIVFSSSRGDGPGGNRTYGWNDQPYVNLYTALIEGDQLTDAVVMHNSINSRFHDGTVTFDKNGRRIYFTRNNYNYGIIEKSEDDEIKLGIFFSDIEEGEYGNKEWSALVPFDHNNANYNVGHPAISPDGAWMYFTSDMPGGMGGTDIWRSQKLGNSWGEPQNVEQVNSVGNEMFPFVSPDGKLFFSSNGHKGLGGLDLYFTQVLETGYGSVQNMGIPFNSRYDEHSVILMEDGMKGFYASNRPGGYGDDDIYGVTILRWPKIFLSGTVVDIVTREPIEQPTIILKDENNEPITDAIIELGTDGKFQIDTEHKERYFLLAVKSGYMDKELEVITAETAMEGVLVEMTKYDFAVEGIVIKGEDESVIDSAKVSIYNVNENLIEEKWTTGNGKYNFPLAPGKEYIVKAEKEGHFKQSARISTKDAEAGVVYKDFKLFLLELDKVVKLDNIYYDYNKAEIRPDAAIELDKLAQTLRDNPSVKIELRSHSDSRGGDAYNKKLSDQRARSAAEYIRSKGIANDRIIAKGYGEEQPVNHCTNGADCTEEQFQENRRTEFKVLEL